MPKPSPSVLPTTSPAPTQTAETGTAVPPTSAASCVTLSYEDNAQVELISSQGRRVMVDVYDPNLLSSPAAEEDVLLTTHTHWDHINADFLKSFPGQQLFTRAGSIQLEYVTIQGIASAHNAGDTVKPEGGTNYLYLILMDGLRIAHFGDIGQTTLTTEQLEALGPVDVAITQFANPYSDMSAENRKGFQLMDQVKPRLIIPTHINLDAAKVAAVQWQGLYSDQDSVQICSTRLTEQTQILFLGDNAEKFGTSLQLLEVDW
jgi:L-ascorbate metabolism protein UlaG (beta-lactamase superfamily)